MLSKEVIARFEGDQPVIVEESEYPSIPQLEKDIRVNVFWRNVEWASGTMITVFSMVKVGADFLTGNVHPGILAIEIGAVVAGVRMVLNGIDQCDHYYDIERAAEKAGLLRPPQLHLPFR